MISFVVVADSDFPLCRSAVEAQSSPASRYLATESVGCAVELERRNIKLKMNFLKLVIISLVSCVILAEDNEFLKNINFIVYDK